MSGRDRPWLMRTYSAIRQRKRLTGCIGRTSREAKQVFRWPLDLPTQTGYDSDHLLARGEVGKVGVPVSHVGDMETLFDGIDLGQMNTSMTINATAPWLLAMYVAVAGSPGCGAQSAERYHAKRCPQRISIAWNAHLSAGTLGSSDQRCHRIHGRGDSGVESHQRVATPPGSGGYASQELAYALSTASAILDSVKASNDLSDEVFAKVVATIFRQRRYSLCRRDGQDARVRGLMG